MTEPAFNDAAPRDGGARTNNSSSRRHSIRPPFAPSAKDQRAVVLAVLVKAGAHGATEAEIASATGLPVRSVAARCAYLRGLGTIVDSGRRRDTPCGCPAAVWVARTAAHALEGGAA